MKLMNKKDLFLLEQIVRKNFASKYKDSVLGILWSVLQPLLIMGILTIIFSTVFGRSIDNYPVYFLSGRSIFVFFTSCVSISMVAIKGNQAILKTINAPKYIFVLGGIISEIINFIISLIILAVVMFATKAPIYLETIPLSIIPIFSITLMIIGIGLFISILATYYTDVRHLWTVISMVLMYSSALFFPMDIIPFQYRRYMILNPLYWAIDQFRLLATKGTIPDVLNMTNLFLISLIILIFGIIIFKRYEKKVAMRF